MATQKALFLITPRVSTWEVRDRAVPKPQEGEVLVKIQATALNPIDWRIPSLGIFFPPFPTEAEYPCVLGFDCAGTVEELGEGVTTLQKGDRVVHIGSFGDDHGTFQQYATTRADLVAKIPASITFDDAASLPLTLVTAVVGLYADRQSEGAPNFTGPWLEGGRDKYKDQPIVIFGGGSSVGQYAIQLAKLSGFSPIITTASLHSSDLCIGLGATHVINRISSDVKSDIESALNGQPVKIIYEAVGAPDTMSAAWDVLADGGVLAHHPHRPFDQAKYPNKFSYEIFGDFNAPHLTPMGIPFFEKLTGLLEEGAIKPNKVEVLSGGLAGISDGLARMEAGEINGKKLVARPQETY